MGATGNLCLGFRLIAGDTRSGKCLEVNTVFECLQNDDLSQLRYLLGRCLSGCYSLAHLMRGLSSHETSKGFIQGSKRDALDSCTRACFLSLSNIPLSVLISRLKVSSSNHSLLTTVTWEVF